MIKFEINGRSIKPHDLANAMQRAILEQCEKHLREKLGSIRHPETGEFPTVLMRGPSVDQLSAHVEGSPELLAVVQQRLQQGNEEEQKTGQEGMHLQPTVFLSYAWEDKSLAEKIAHALQVNGIDTWWAEWCIGPGDSLRRKIEEGLAGCTHFIVLLTPISLQKPWVNQEMDAALVLKLKSRCKFIALRHGLPAENLPHLLAGMQSPEVTDPDKDIAQLISDIYGVSRKPPLGRPPAIVAEASELKPGYSSAASAVAKVFVERSPNAFFGEPQLTFQELRKVTLLSEDDVEDALHELSGMIQVTCDRVLPKEELFATFDTFWKSWNPSEDGLRLAADLLNDDQFPEKLPDVAQRYDWEPRRLNPVITYLVSRDIVMGSKTLGTYPWISAWIKKTASTRRFVRSRS